MRSNRLRARTGLAWVASLAMAGCLGAPAELPPCDPNDARHAICGLSNAEDLAWLPGGEWVIASEMRVAAAHDANEAGDPPTFVSGGLTALRPLVGGERVERRRLFPAGPMRLAANATRSSVSAEQPASPVRAERWGDPACAGPPSSQDFEPHGIDVGIGPGGIAALAVVTHGRREVIDLFEILAGGEPALAWRGCVEMLEGISANDVVLLGDAGLLATNMLPRFESFGAKALWNGLKISLGANTGSVLRWTPGPGGGDKTGAAARAGAWSELERSQGSAPNGIAISPDRRDVYVAEWGGEAVYRLRFADGLRAGAIPERDEVEVAGSPDNLTWTRDGRLLVAAQQAGPLDAIRCAGIEAGGCDLAYSVTSIEPAGFEATRIAEGRGAASVALEVGDELWIGVFVGDAIERRPARNGSD